MMRQPSEAEIKRAAKGICRERCAHMGEPPCFQVSREANDVWPPESCGDPGCMTMAAVALVLFLNPSRKP